MALEFNVIAWTLSEIINYFITFSTSFEELNAHYNLTLHLSNVISFKRIVEPQKLFLSHWSLLSDSSLTWHFLNIPSPDFYWWDIHVFHKVNQRISDCPGENNSDWRMLLPEPLAPKDHKIHWWVQEHLSWAHVHR